MKSCHLPEKVPPLSLKAPDNFCLTSFELELSDLDRDRLLFAVPMMELRNILPAVILISVNILLLDTKMLTSLRSRLHKLSTNY